MSLCLALWTSDTSTYLGMMKSERSTLNENLEIVREEAMKIQSEEQLKREKEGSGLNAYQEGDMVFRRVRKMVDKATKLTPNYLGPYEVVSVHKADVTCKHLVTGANHVLHMDTLKICLSTREEAYDAALVDYNQFVIEAVKGYKGDPEKRMKMFFWVKFKDGDAEWLPYCRELADTVPFEDYVRKNKPLIPLLYTLETWNKMRKEEFRDVQGVEPGDLCYVDLRAWGADYFESLGILETGETYVVLCEYKRWAGKTKKKIELKCDLFDQQFYWDSFCVYAYGGNKSLEQEMVLVDEEFCEKHPQIKRMV